MGATTVWTYQQKPHVVTPPAVEEAARRFTTGITPETTASLVEAIASDKATRMRTLAKATVVMCAAPEWMRAEEVNAFFGIPVNQLKDMVVSGQVIAKKLDPTLTQSAVIFKVADIRRAIGKLTDYAEWLRTRPDLAIETRTCEK